MKAFIYRQYDGLKSSRHHLLRKFVGVLLIIGGILGFLPVLGFWMIPIGLGLLAVDWPVARRLSRRLTVGWGRLKQRVRR